MSRANFRKSPLVIAAILVVVPIYAFFAYVFLLDRRVRREFSEHQWRSATEIIGIDADRRIATVASVYGTDWRSTSPLRMEAIPSFVSNAFIAGEDIRFRKHIGIDPIGIGRAFLTNLKAGGVAQGGSTINQQLIKAKFLTQKRTVRRKVVEVLLAVALDMRVGKDEILEAYLNDVYLGHVNGRPVLGVDEGARIFFNRRPAQLTVGQAALIAGIIRAPNRDTPRKRPQTVRARRDAILRAMRVEGWISERDLTRAMNEAIRFTPGPAREAPFPFYLSALRNELVGVMGESVLQKGGLRVYAEIDVSMQRRAEASALQGTRRLASRYGWIAEQSRHEPLQVCIVSMSPATGGVRALVGGSNFGTSPIDRSLSMRRQPGSAFKTFAFLAAIESRKATAASLLLDSPLTVEVSAKETWQPHNYDERYRGRVTLREAFEKSLNVPTVRLTQRIGISRVVDAAERFGFEEDFPAIPALPLGVTEVTPRELTSAYTVFPNLGRRTEPFLLSQVKDRNGKLLYQRKSRPDDVVSPEIAYVMHSLLRGVVRRGTASRLKNYGLGGVAGKTGTTSDYRDAWFVGYGRDLVTTVWVGYDHGAPLRLSSAEAAIPIWGSYMSGIRLDKSEIPAPEGVITRAIDPESGYLWAEGCPGPFKEVFLSGTAPSHGCPRGVIGKVIRRVLFDDETFDEPAAITFDKFRRWSAEVDQNRQRFERRLGRVKRMLGMGGG